MPTLLEELGGEAGCERFSAAFYARVGKDATLRRLFPGKTLRCATEEFAAFLIQFLGGDEDRTQHRWWLSLSESHARFRIGAAERSAWLKNMDATIEASPLSEATRDALRQFFVRSSAYVVTGEIATQEHAELSARWRDQLVLDDAVAAIASGEDDRAVAMTPRFAERPSVFVGLLSRMVRSGRPRLIRFVVDALHRDPALGVRRFGGITLLHVASGAGGLEIVSVLLGLGVNADIEERGRHTPLYYVANECASPSGPEVVRALIAAGADVNACSGVTRATALHMAARRGHVEVARALIECGAAMEARDAKGVTPFQRAVNCRREAIAQLFKEHRAR